MVGNVWYILKLMYFFMTNARVTYYDNDEEYEDAKVDDCTTAIYTTVDLLGRHAVIHTQGRRQVFDFGEAKNFFRERGGVLKHVLISARLFKIF